MASFSNDEQDAGPPLPNLSGGQYINLGTVAPAYGISQKKSQPDYLEYDEKRGVVPTMFANTGKWNYDLANFVIFVI